MKKVFVGLIAILVVSGVAEYYSHSVLKDKTISNEQEISKLLAEKKEKEEKFQLTEIKLKRFQDENKDLKELKEGKK